MATINYKEKYEKAVHAAMLAKQDTESAVTIRILEEIFPELKESEDERIRKSIINLVIKSAQNGGMALHKWESQQMLDWLEKQGKTSHILSNSSNIGKDEQKPADKVEPKFKVDDWVVISTSEGRKIVQVVSIEYFQSGQPRYITSEDRWFGNGTKARLWDITKDAKDGDVLVLNNEVFIYAHRKQMYSIAVAHCFVDSAGNFYLDGEFGYKEYGKTISPATKEQRDLLFQKMKEAGYEWDAEKKKLIKIEQKPAWSEEDEDVLEDVEEAIINYWHGQSQEDLLDWLKSLKERYTWKPSEEQMEALANALSLAKNCGEESAFELRILYEQLSKLRE